MTTAALDHLGVGFSLAVLAVALILYGLHLYLTNRRYVRAERARRTETDGSLHHLADERRRRVERAQFRHAVRHTRRQP